MQSRLIISVEILRKQAQDDFTREENEEDDDRGDQHRPWEGQDGVPGSKYEKYSRQYEKPWIYSKQYTDHVCKCISKKALMVYSYSVSRYYAGVAQVVRAWDS